MRRLLAIALVGLCMIKGFSQEITDPKATEVWEPEPKVVTPGTNGSAPSDAIILFDGKNLDKWVSAESDKQVAWAIADGAMTVVPGTGGIKTKQSFGDIQLHIEWRTPAKVEHSGQDRGNSGIFFQGKYELQVLDSYNNRTYSNGQAGSMYKQHAPLVNATRPPGEWQAYDVVYIAPRFKDDGTLQTPGRMTVFLNGVVVQHYSEILGTTEYIGKPKIKAHGNAPLTLQDHSCAVSYRNIWVREL